MLDDDAYIYQKKEQKTEKQKWKEMDKNQRKQYFLDYYLFKTVTGILICAIALFLTWHCLKPTEENILYVAVIDESLDEDKIRLMTEELNTLYKTDGKFQKVLIDDSFYMKDDALSKLEIYLHSSQIDVIITDERLYTQFAGYGFLKDLSEALEGQKEKYEDCFLYTAGYLDDPEEETAFEDHETGQGEIFPYGMDISESKKFADMKNYIEKPVFAIAVNAPNQDNAAAFLEYLLN